MEIFGVFDGHGGKQAAVYASKHMMGAVLSALDQHIGKDGQDCQAGASDSMSIPTKHAPDSNREGGPQLTIHPSLDEAKDGACAVLCMHACPPRRAAANMCFLKVTCQSGKGTFAA